MTVIAMAAVGITAVMLAVQFKALKGEYGICLFFLMESEGWIPYWRVSEEFRNI